MSTKQFFKDLINESIVNALGGSLNEGVITIDVDHTGEGIAKDQTKYKIKIKTDAKNQTAKITGQKKDIIKFLTGPSYDLEMADVEDMFPELMESKTAKVTPKSDDGEGMDPVGKADGDIDNDGDEDESDEYLAKRRKAIGKSIKKESVGEFKKESAGEFKKGDKVTVKNAKSYDALAKSSEVSGVIEFPTRYKGDDVYAVKVGSGQYSVYPKDLVKESVDLLEGALGDYKELIKYANADGGGDKGDILKAAALMAKGDKEALQKHLGNMDKTVVAIIKSYMD